MTNETTEQNALRSRLAVDGFFASAVRVVEGLNRIQVLGRANDGSIGRDTITVHYEPGGKRSPIWNFSAARKESGFGGGTTQTAANDDYYPAMLFWPREYEECLETIPKRARAPST